jgi:hypothetical protein
MAVAPPSRHDGTTVAPTPAADSGRPTARGSTRHTHPFIQQEVFVMRHAFLAVLVLTVAAGCLQAAQDDAEPHREPNTGIVFPKTLGSMQGGAVHTYDKPELGISVRYSAPGFFKADVYVYDAGIKNLGTGIKAEAVKPHFKEVQDMLPLMQQQGKYKGVKKLSEQETVLVAGAEKTPALIACYEYSEVPGRQEVEYAGKRVSYILVTAYKDNFLKVRFTFPEKDKKQGDALLKKLQADLGGLLK